MSCDGTRFRSIVLVPPTRATESGALDLLLSVDLAEFDFISLTLVVLSGSGDTPSLTVTVTMADLNESDYFTTLATFDAATGDTKQNKASAAFGRYLSAKWAISGTSPVFVFTVVGTAKG